MNIEVQPGRYVVAVSGGVDSVVLLHMLSQKPKVALVVAHYDHGIREDSTQDRRFVEQLAKQYEVPFVYDEGHLGKTASEAQARDARYRFLRTVQKTTDADAIITAHHQDDMIETALLNLLRGTGRKGMGSLRSAHGIIRPLLHVPKQELINYATTHHLEWREDITNKDLTIKRNYIRHKVAPKLTARQRAELLSYITKFHDLNHKLDNMLINQLHIQPSRYKMNRAYFIHLPHTVAKEVLAMWLRLQGVRDFDTKGLERMVVAAKTYAPGLLIDVNNRCHIKIYKSYLALELRDR